MSTSARVHLLRYLKHPDGTSQLIRYLLGERENKTNDVKRSSEIEIYSTWSDEKF